MPVVDIFDCSPGKSSRRQTFIAAGPRSGNCSDVHGLQDCTNHLVGNLTTLVFSSDGLTYSGYCQWLHKMTSASSLNNEYHWE